MTNSSQMTFLHQVYTILDSVLQFATRKKYEIVISITRLLRNSISRSLRKYVSVTLGIVTVHYYSPPSPSLVGISRSRFPFKYVTILYNLHF